MVCDVDRQSECAYPVPNERCVPIRTLSQTAIRKAADEYRGENQKRQSDSERNETLGKKEAIAENEASEPQQC